MDDLPLRHLNGITILRLGHFPDEFEQLVGGKPSTSKIAIAKANLLAIRKVKLRQELEDSGHVDGSSAYLAVAVGHHHVEVSDHDGMDETHASPPPSNDHALGRWGRGWPFNVKYRDGPQRPEK
jgi:hypothetical protein